MRQFYLSQFKWRFEGKTSLHPTSPYTGNSNLLNHKSSTNETEKPSKDKSKVLVYHLQWMSLLLGEVKLNCNCFYAKWEETWHELGEGRSVNVPDSSEPWLYNDNIMLALKIHWNRIKLFYNNKSWRTDEIRAMQDPVFLQGFPYPPTLNFLILKPCSEVSNICAKILIREKVMMR